MTDCVVSFPQDTKDLLKKGERFRAELRRIKQRLVVPDYGWYPYDSLSALEILTRLLEPVFGEIMEDIVSGPIADIGCGDGDLGLFWAHLGAQVDAVDHLESNYNQMRGVTVLRHELDVPLGIHDVNLDSAFCLPSLNYRLAFFLGTLYHLKNPYYVLENLAMRADWCILSTRIARVTPRRIPIEDEPVAYLLGAREANNDPTNYWIFSTSGLLRLLDRSGWTVFNCERVGQTVNSDPVCPEADERIFVLLKSKPRHPELLVRPTYGWFAPENGAWRWTAKRFGLDVVPPADCTSSEFALRIKAPAPLFELGQQVRVTCSIDDDFAGAITCAKQETLEFRGRFPNSCARGVIHLDFQVESSYSPSGGDVRDLGVIVPLLDESTSGGDRIPFRVS